MASLQQAQQTGVLPSLLPTVQTPSWQSQQIMQVLPALSVATAMMVFVLLVIVMVALQSVVPVARMPFTMTVTIAVSSDAVPEMVIEELIKIAPLAGDVIASVGNVVSASDAFV